MQRLASSKLVLEVSEDGLDVALEDRQRGVRWILDLPRGSYAETLPESRSTYAALTPFGPGRVSKGSARILCVEYPLPDGYARYTWELLEDGLEVRLEVRSERVRRIAHPGALRPERGKLELLVPRNQGLLLRETGPEYSYRRPIAAGSGSGISLSMLGCLAEQGGLLLTGEDIQDTSLVYGKDGQGLYAWLDLTPCAVDGWYERRVRIYPCARSITAVAKRHRQRLVERGDFVAWDEKIRKKPILERLFGALIAFIGYRQGKETDYAASAQALRKHGFETVFYYPVRMNPIVPYPPAGGEAPIWLSDEELHALQAAGGILAPWNWTYEALDTGSDEVRRLLRTDRQGQTVVHWQMDQLAWHEVCARYQSGFVRKQYDGPMREMGWAHFDVNALLGGSPCFRTDHDLHGGRPLTAREAQRAVAELLGAEVNGNRVVSSEGFTECFAHAYDMGSNKFDPAWGGVPFVPVPLTMLVFHDSLVHNWWEVFAYNDLPNKPRGECREGPGRAEQKAALDALYGCPPLVFPFGRQYTWAGGEQGRTVSYEIHLTDPEVQRALKAALPVARLHKKIGRLELTGFEFLTEDFAVQATRFSDGTRVVANFADEAREVSGAGLLPGNSWKTLG